jgi:hypothetical protein
MWGMQMQMTPPGSTDQMAQISKDWDPNLVKKAVKKQQNQYSI